MDRENIKSVSSIYQRLDSKGLLVETSEDASHRLQLGVIWLEKFDHAPCGSKQSDGISQQLGGVRSVLQQEAIRFGPALFNFGCRVLSYGPYRISSVLL